ncbi:hypothetical protein L1987_15178 [Smallanthus sonchifolius]|uniref:Uncharacterized protein n=1 Tax=Smallanthus sonchifolius TaxID=185202 RepID=A0ACB9J5W7_9ASTR|nr:hypothetical protein L1987_15178 [Smallanthus sonchifolius]
MQPEERDDDDFVTPPPPKTISKKPQPKRTHKEISRSKSGKQPEAQVENQYYEFTVVLEEDDGYDTEEEEYLAICNEYKENEENDFMISESGNHLILPTVSQVWMNHCTPPEDDDKHIKEHFDAHEETENVVDKIEEDNVSSEATETDHEEEHNLYENLIHEESSPEALNLQMVIVKDKNHIVDKNEDCEFDTEEHINSKGGRKMEDGGEKNTMKNPEVVVNIKNLEYEIKTLKDERNEDLENMLKQLKLERELVKDIKNLRNGSIFYLNSIKEVLDLPIGDLKQMIHLKEDGKDISSKERHTILCMNKFIFDDEKMHPHYDQTPNNDTLGKCGEIQTSEKITSQKSHEGSLDDEPVYDETPQTISSIINKDVKLDSKQCNEEKVEGKIFGKMSFNPPSFKLISQLTPEGNKEDEPIQNQTEDSGEVDINKLIKENNILDAEFEKTPVGSRIGVSNVQSPLTITVVEKVEYDMGNKQREERNRKLLERFCSPYLDR